MSTPHEVATEFHRALTTKNFGLLQSIMTDDVTWSLPGDNHISGTASGRAAVIERARLIASYGVNFELLHVLVSPTNMALSLHNTAQRGDVALDEHLATVCFLNEGKIRAIETYLSDVEGMNAFFSVLPEESR